MNPIDSAGLRPHYSAFLESVPGRILLTGHSHQAWPDVAREGLDRAFRDAAQHVDDKWSFALSAADAVRHAVASSIGAKKDEIALGASTHELVCRLLSSLDLHRRRHVVTSSGEFHSLDRQLSRMAEDGLEVERVQVEPVSTLSERMAARVRSDTAAILCSSVLFETSTRVPALDAIAHAGRRVGAVVVIDAYHAFNVVPFRLEEFGNDVFVTAGGYKYAQWGEGNAWLRVPADTELRPRFTGWFSDFASVHRPRSSGPVGYGDMPADRFAGATYDPSSHYRARAVIEFFSARDLDVSRLRALSIRQTTRIVEGLADVLTLASPRDSAARGGFVAFRTKDAARWVEALRARGVISDARGEMLRLGPAPYSTDDELDSAIEHLRRLALQR